jgi:hypothetical protein
MAAIEYGNNFHSGKWLPKYLGTIAESDKKSRIRLHDFSRGINSLTFLRRLPGKSTVFREFEDKEKAQTIFPVSLYRKN